MEKCCGQKSCASGNKGKARGKRDLTLVTKFVSREQALSGAKWHIVDAAGATLGRLSTQVAGLIRGKHKPTYSPNQECGDFVIVINASQIKLTGNKLADKVYYKHTGYIGHLKQNTAGQILEKDPAKLIEMSVKGMLPKGVLGKHIGSRLKVYAGAEHPHAAQVAQVYVPKYPMTTTA